MASPVVSILQGLRPISGCPPSSHPVLTDAALRIFYVLNRLLEL
jgi:hypothetical protein